jgi:DNA-binding transcriptional LysR family regulator
MDLRRLEIFAKVAELGSFSRAAEALFLTQPTVSEHIRSLEEEVGVQLLDRLGRGTAPTRAGQLLLGYANRMLGLGREARQAMDRFQGRVLGELVVGGSTIPGEYVLPELVGQCKRKYREISTCLLIGSSQQVTEWLEASRVEVVVVGAPCRTGAGVVAFHGRRAGRRNERGPSMGPARDHHARRAPRR